MLSTEELLSGVLLVCLALLLWCYTKPAREGYGSHYQPEIQENTMLMRGPFDDMDYINPVLLI